MNPRTRASGPGLVIRFAAIAAVGAAASAIWIQDHTQALPLGLFNEGRALYARLSALCLGVAILVLAVLLLELLWGVLPRGAAALRAALGSLLLFEALLGIVDANLVSRGASPPLGGPYRELRAPDGGWVFLKKAHAGSPLGFRRITPARPEGPRPRILFLGDSYTEGSGRALACNYPEVAAATLSSALGREVHALNAGVAGYGPVDALRLLGLLLDRGYRFDLVVYSLFLENDFTDNLPGTTRRVVAGINYRFPESFFLRLFHPLNTRSFRYAVFMERAGRLMRGGAVAARREEGRCRLEPQPTAELPSELESLVRRRFAASTGPDARLATGVVRNALWALRTRAAERGLTMQVVVFPERLRVDGSLQTRLGVPATALADDRLLDLIREVAPDAIDVRPALMAGSENYRPDDTHLSDLGNLRAGRYVGRMLARRLGSGWSGSDDPSSGP